VAINESRLTREVMNKIVLVLNGLLMSFTV